MSERQNRTIICSVLFLDIVEYSRKPVAEQMNLRDRLNNLLSAALKGVALNERVILDTGDGAAVSFLGDPEDALFMALVLRDSLGAEVSYADGGFRMRFGINLGPVKLVKDLNGRPNIIGDGINVAQRVMSFSEPGQMLVSRSYYEVVSRLSDEYSRLFQYEGSRTDKHVREHEVYAVSPGGPIPARSCDASWSARLAARGKGGAALARLAGFAARIADRLHASPKASTACAILLILASAFGVRVHRDNTSVAGAGSSGAETQRVEQIAEPQAALQVEPAHPLTLLAAAAAAAGGDKERTPRPTEAAPQAPPKTPAIRKAPAKKQATPEPVEPADPTALLAATAAGGDEKRASEAKEPVDPGNLVTITLAIFPWGEVYVDGKQWGVSPPTRSIQVTPGPHEIEFRNTTFPTRVERIDLGSGDQVTIRHRFQAGASQ